MQRSISGPFKGPVFPVVYGAETGLGDGPGPLIQAYTVGQGAILDAAFGGFSFNPPPGFSEMMVEQRIL